MSTTNPDISAKAGVHSNAIMNKSNYWMSYLDNLVKNLNIDDGFYLYRKASLWASTFSYIEWLIIISNYKIKPTQTEVAIALQKIWGWSEDIGKVFWSAGRNPIAHVGQVNTFHSFRNYNGMPTNVDFNNGVWSRAVTNDWYKYNLYTAVSIAPPFNGEDGDVQIIAFFHQILLSDLLPKLAEHVVSQIKNERDPNNINKLEKLNRQIPY